MTEHWRDDSFDVPSLTPATPQELEVHLAAVEHSLTNAIIIRDRDDIQSAKHWSERLEPFAHQVRNLITFCRRAPVALIADDVGLGKTISAGLIMSELFTRGKISRALVVCPKILLPQWKTELGERFGITAEHTDNGKSLPELIKGDVPVLLTTYHKARNHIAAVRNAGFGMLVLDEAHKLKSLYGSKQPAKLAVAIRKALADSAFTYVLMLTATPIQTSPWDLYSLIDCLSIAKHHGHPLGSPAQFKQRFLQPLGNSRFRLRPDRVHEFRQIVSQYIVRTSKGTANLPFPKREVLQHAARGDDGYDVAIRLLKDVIEYVDPMNQVNLAATMMSSNAAFAKQLHNMSQKNRLLRPFVRRAEGLAEEIPLGPKFAGLKELVDTFREQDSGFRLVVFTMRVETLRALQAALEALGVRVGTVVGDQAALNGKAIADFTADTPRVNVLLCTQVGEEGVNLQVANVVVNYDLPWNPMRIEQRIGRVQRLGSKFETVQVFNLVVANSIEQRVVARLLQRLQDISSALGDLEGILEAAGFENDEADFQLEIRKLVVEALKGADVEAALKATEANIEQAKKAYQQELVVVEETLGKDLEAMHSAGPPLPDLEPIQPRMTVQELVTAAYEADGATVQTDGQGRLRICPKGQAGFIATFNRDDPYLNQVGQFTHASGLGTRYFDNGSQPFERLVGEWAAKRLHVVREARSSPLADPLIAARNWVNDLGQGFVYAGAQVSESESEFHGTLYVHATISVAHDRLERRLEIEMAGESDPAALDSVHEDLTGLSDDLELETNSSMDYIHEEIEEHADLRQFFDFYRKRLSEEVSKAAGKPALERLAREHFTPQYSATVHGASGVIADNVVADIEFTIDGKGPYQERIRVAVGRVLEVPELRECVVSKRMVPVGALGTCAISGAEAVRHELIASSKSMRLGLPEHAVNCQVTGNTLLADEVGTCVTTGQVVDLDLLGTCAVTGAQVLKDRLATCDFTQALVREDVLAISQVSGRRLRRDEEQISGVSGVTGHKSEFATCMVTGVPILPEEGGRSSISGDLVRKDLLFESERNPGRWGMQGEIVTCAITGKSLLSDEVVRSAVSDLPADPDHMSASDRSGLPALPDELQLCELSNERILPSEGRNSSISGKFIRKDLLFESDKNPGRWGVQDETVTCAITGKRLLVDEVVESAISGLKADPDRMSSSQLSGLLAMPGELKRCEVSNQRILPSEGRLSAISGKFVRSDLLLESDKNPGRWAVPFETVVCAITGKRLLVDEARESAVSGRKADPDHMVTSQKSGHFALPGELVRCEVSGILLAPVETTVCEHTGQRVDVDLVGVDHLSGRTVLARLMQRCPETGHFALPVELAQCEETGNLVDPAVLTICSVSNKRVLSRLTITCADCGRPLLRTLASTTADGQSAHPECIVTSVWSRKTVLVSDSVRCRGTGVRLPADEVSPKGFAERIVETRLRSQQGAAEDTTHLSELSEAFAARGVKLSAAWIAISPSGTVAAATACEKSWLGLKRRFVSGFVSLTSREVVGRLWE